jgi:hypothetical protein
MRIEKTLLVEKGPYGIDKDGVLRITDIIAYSSREPGIDLNGSLNVPGDVTFYPNADGFVGITSDNVVSAFEFDGEFKLPVIQS